MPGGGEVTAETLVQLADAFHGEHLTQFAYNRPEMNLEVLHWRVAASGRQARTQVEPPPSEPHVATPLGSREAYSLSIRGMEKFDVYDLAAFGPGASAAGPAIVATPTTTIVLHRGDRIRRTGDEGFHIDIATR